MTMRQFANVKEMLENQGIKFITDYSGRGMFGKETLALVANSKAEVVNLLLCCDKLPRSLIKAIKNARQDSFGKDKVVIY